MSVTVETLLKLPILQENSQLLTDTGLDNEVQYVTVAETSDMRFPSFGTHVFVLTTLSAYSDSLEKINNVVRGLCEVNIAAIGIKLGRFINEIDPSTIQIAREHNVALLSISSSVYFREILSDTLSLITGNQRQILNKINHINRALMDAILQNRSIQDMLDILCREIDCYCCCLNTSGKKIAWASSLPNVQDYPDTQEAIDQFLQQREAYNETFFQSGDTFIFPCFVQEEMPAAFCIVVRDPAADLVVPLSQAIVSGISVKFMEQNLENQARRGIVSATLDDILFSGKSSHKMAAERLEFLNFVPQKNFLIILLSRPVSAQKRSWFYTIESIQRVFAAEFPSAISFKRGNEYILLVSYNSDALTARLKSVLEQCQDTLIHMECERFDLGCSTPVTDLSKMSTCYLQAKKAVQFGRILDPSGRVYLYDDYFELGLISCGIGSGESGIFFERIINPILEYDRQFKTDLWPTLEASFSNDKLEQIAGELYIHISTLRYRLQKVESLTGYSFFNSHDKLTLYLAFLLYKISA